MKTLQVTAARLPVPKEGTKRRIENKRDTNAIHPGEVITVPDTPYYRGLLRSGELQPANAPKPAERAKE